MPHATSHSSAAGVTELARLIQGRRVVVLAGAGCSTESGIPDYRGPDAPRRSRPPVQYQEFVRDPAARVRYWARSTIGWPRFSASRPNQAHNALARMEAAGAVAGVITQNVDGLHHAAGSRRVVELHGNLGWVRCLDCAAAVRRHAWQGRLLEENGAWAERLRAVEAGLLSAPDGDAELPADVMAEFRVPPCDGCGGLMKPDVVFFGENVPRERVAEAWALFGDGDVLLVAGSSLTVYSGRRFIYRAAEQGVPVAVVNIGPTRADDVAAVRVEGRLGQVLPAVAEAVGAA
jgi:NAD+-dependent protein deacetylase sirtuin 4